MLFCLELGGPALGPPGWSPPCPAHRHAIALRMTATARTPLLRFVVNSLYNKSTTTWTTRRTPTTCTTNLQHLNARKVTDTNQQVHSKSATNSQQIEVVESGPISAHYATRMSFVHIYFSITLGDLLEKQLNLLPQMMWNVSPC